MATNEKQAERMRMIIRIILCGCVASLLLFGLGLRLWQVQALQGVEHTQAVSRQSIRTVRLNPLRGRIYGRNGTLIVGNTSVYDVVFHTAEMRQPGERQRTIDHILRCEERLAEWIGRPSRLDEKRLLRHILWNPALPLTVFRNLDEGELCRIWEMEPWIHGMAVEPREVRDYRFPGMMSQVLGFTGSVMPNKEFEGTDYSHSYVMAEMEGRSGLERQYNQQLSGQGGAKLVRVDSLGYVRDELPDSLPARPGNDLVLTIDPRAQSIGEELLEGHKGALVVVEAATGAVVAMVSKPGFSLTELTADSYRQMNSDNENKPLVNRAVNALYTPGSIVKPLVGMAALESGAIDTEWRHDCCGYYTIGNQRIHCARRVGHGSLDIYDAITVSCNPFFMAVGLKTTIDALSPMFAAAGFGEKTGIDIEEHARGLCPAPQAARDRLRRRWLIIDTAYCSMGQGLVQVTPLQMAVYCGALANGGNLMRPYLVEEIRNAEGQVVRRTAPMLRRHLPVSPVNLEVVRTAMVNAVESTQGSGHLLDSIQITDAVTGQLRGVGLAAKTGTAEIGRGEKKTKDTWMISYGPLPQATYAFACVVEHGESGSRTVAPIACAFWQRWLAILEEEKRQTLAGR